MKMLGSSCSEERILRLFVLTLLLCAEIRRQLCHQVLDERRHLPASILLERNLAGERVELQHHFLIEVLTLEMLRFAKQFKLHCFSNHRMFVLLRLFKTASSVLCVTRMHALRKGETSALQFELRRSNPMSAPHYQQLERKWNKMVQLWAKDRCRK